MGAQTYGANGGGLPTGWAGTWGPMADGRSQLARLAAEIEADILEELLGRRVRRGQRHRVRARLPRLMARDVVQVARLRALAAKTIASVGRELKASPRAAAGVQARADTLLNSVRERLVGTGRGGARNDLATALARQARQARTAEPRPETGGAP